MKYIIFFLMISSFSFSQVKHHKTDFKIIDNILIWDQVYETKKTIDDIYKILKTNTYFKNVEKLDNTITFETIEKVTPHQKHRESAFISSFMFKRKRYSGHIDFKENRYKVSIQNIEFLDDDARLNNFQKNTNLEEYVLNNKKTDFKKTAQILNSLVAFNNYFKSIFDFNKEVVKDDW